jgi:hypothetical protein
MTQPILTVEEVLAWNEKTAQNWRQLLTTHPELLTQPCDIAGTKTVAELLQHIVAVHKRQPRQACRRDPSDDCKPSPHGQQGLSSGLNRRGS